MRRDYDFGQQLGKGSFGVVFKVRRKADGRTFVCKELQLQSMSKKVREEANQEVRLLRKVSSGCEYIVRYIASFLEGECLHIVMEFCEHGDLSGYVKARAGKSIEEQTVWKFAVQIGLGLRWLHRNRILHRDIKTLNVFLTAADDARLGDLGVARVLSHNTNFADTFVGTPYYLSPELCEEKPYNELSDVWAFGCVVYEMCTLKHPFEAKNHAALLIKILRGQFAPITERYSADLRTLIDGCMRRDWMKRTKLADLLGSAAVRTWAERLGISLEDQQPGSSGGGAPAKAAAASAPEAPGRPPQKPPPARTAAVPAAAPRPGSAGAAARAPARDLAPKVRPTPQRRASEQPLPLRARDRKVGDRRAGGGLRKPCAEDRPGAATRTLVAAPASRSAAQVVRNAPARIAARPAGAPPAAPSGRGAGAPGTPTNGSPASSGQAGLRRPSSGADERRRAAREVADLPDVVLPTVARAPRNVPSVHQLFQLGPEPVPTRPASCGSLRSGGASPPCGNATATSAEPFLRKAAELSDDMTMLPEERTALPQQAEEEVAEEVAEEVQEEAEEEVQEGDEEVQEEMEGEEDGHEEGGLSRTGAAAQVQARAHTVPLHQGGDLTVNSVFGTHRGLEDSLSYTADDTMASFLQTGAAPEPEEGGTIVGWAIAELPEEQIAGEEEQEESFQPEEQEEGSTVEESASAEQSVTPNAKLDSNGLLCDAHWQPLPTQLEITPLLVEPSIRVSSGEASPVSAADPTSARAPASEGRSPRAGGGGRSPTDKLTAKVTRLTSQIARLHADVVRDLDAPARAAWDDLYRLFQEKMSADLTDEDQSEIERHVFEQLPTESTDLIWKVYKVLHLEQERDRCQRLLAG